LVEHFPIWIERHLIDPFPVSGIAAPSLWMCIASRLIDGMAGYQQVFILPVMPLRWRYELNAAVAMVMAVPLNELLHPLP
jgi:hypothetical protein